MTHTNIDISNSTDEIPTELSYETLSNLALYYNEIKKTIIGFGRDRGDDLDRNFESEMQKAIQNLEVILKSLEEESFVNYLLEYPQYTSPKEWKNLCIPEELLSGHHQKIKNWRLNKSEEITKKRRPDLWERHKSLRNH